MSKLKEGYIGSYKHHTGRGMALVGFRCETDFCSRSLEFQRFANDFARHFYASEEDLTYDHFWNERFLTPNNPEGLTVKESFDKLRESVKEEVKIDFAEKFLV
jgi:translation elongation factor EF-Ts